MISTRIALQNAAMTQVDCHNIVIVNLIPNNSEYVPFLWRHFDAMIDRGNALLLLNGIYTKGQVLLKDKETTDISVLFV